MSSISASVSATSDSMARLSSPADDKNLLPAEVYLAEREAEAADRQRVEELWNEIAEVAAHIHAATYRLLVLVAEFDQREGWACGFASCAHWLAWRIGMNLGAARERVRVARALEKLPLTSAAMECGELSYSKARALTRVATPEREENLLHFARAGTAAHVERLVRAWRSVDRQNDLEEARRESRSLSYGFDEEGMLVVRGRLDPETGAVVVRALEAAEQKLWQEAREAGEGEMETSPGQRRADGLGLVAEGALGDGLEGANPGDDRYQVVVHVDEAVLRDPEAPGRSVLEDGVSVSAETSRRLCCDGSRVVMTRGPDGSTVDVGRRTRIIPPAIRRALEHRDGGCRFPGCRAKRCDAHHIEHWGEGGETKLENLLKLCRRHHRAVHEEGFRVERRECGEVRFFWPDGSLLPKVPVCPVPGVGAWEALRRRQEGGVVEDLPVWGGDRCDWEMAVAGFYALHQKVGDVSAETSRS